MCIDHISQFCHIVISSRLKLQNGLIHAFIVNRAMITAAEYGETSWELSVQIDQKDGDESMKFKLRVKGDLHIGGLMLKLVEKISKCTKEIISCCDAMLVG